MLISLSLLDLNKGEKWREREREKRRAKMCYTMWEIIIITLKSFEALSHVNYEVVVCLDFHT